MQGLKDNGIAVIAMKDFLAWRQAEKNIPPRSCIITIDDGYVSGLQRCLADLKTVRLHYLCTIFIYTNYVNVGGKSITWAQLEEMRDAGVDIESLTVSHHDLRHAPKGQDYTPCCTMRSTPPSGSWKTNPGDAAGNCFPDVAFPAIAHVMLRHAQFHYVVLLKMNKKRVTVMDPAMAPGMSFQPSDLGIKVTGLALTYGTYNETVRQVVLAAGYQALFTLDGRLMGIEAHANNLGCYAIESD